MLTVWGGKTSSNVQALIWCIGEIGLPYKRHNVGHKYGGTDSDEFYNINPNCTVPVLQDSSNTPLWETGAILRYLANRYGSESFWPAELLAKTEVDRWAEWSKLNIAQAFTAPVFWRVVRTPGISGMLRLSAQLWSLRNKASDCRRVPGRTQLFSRGIPHPGRHSVWSRIIPFLRYQY